MKTTVEISDALLRAAKRMAVERNMTLRLVIEAALRRYVEAAADETQTLHRSCAAAAFAGAACSRD